MTEIPTSEVLNRAADLIEDYGWGQGVGSMIGAGGVCVMGAILHAVQGRFARPDENDQDTYDVVDACPAGQAMYRYLALPEGSELFDWNDKKVRTQSEVVEAIRACAVIEASREREAAEVSA